MAIAALAVITIALIGQAIEMRKIRVRTYGDDSIGSPNIFLDKRNFKWYGICLLYTSPSPRDQRGSRMPSSA